MQRIIALLLAALLVLGMTACAKEEGLTLADKLEEQPAVQQSEEPAKQEAPEKPEPEKPEKSEKPEKTEKPERPDKTGKTEKPAAVADYTAYDGIYRLNEVGAEGEQTYLQFRGFPEFLLLEVFETFEGSTYSFWVEEFWPDEGYVLGTDTKLQGKSQTFSLMSRGNIYAAMPLDRNIILEEDTITLEQEGYDPEVYVRDDSFGPYHTPEEELRQRLEDMYTVRPEPSLVGCWNFWDGWRTIRVNLEEDGGFHFLYKEPGCPIRIVDGVWGIDQETEDICIVAELAGDGNYPYHVTWQWRLDENSYLYLVDEEEFLLKELGNDIGFWCAEESDPLNMSQLDAMGYVWESYDLFGEYTDQYGTEYTYRYRLPVFLEESGDLGEINAEILDFFVPIIEEELAAMEQNEFLSTDVVDWDLYVTEDIVTLHVYGLSWEVEQHRTWYYDLRSGKRVDSGVLLRRLGLKETEFLSCVRDAAEAYYLETFAGMPEEDREAYGYYDKLEWTLSDEAVNLDLPIFMDRQGHLCVYARIGSVAGAGEFWAPLYPLEDWDVTGAVG